MPTVKLVEEPTADARVRAIYADIKETKGLYNQFNKLADAFQVEPDILPAGA